MKRPDDSLQQMALPRECERRYYANCKLDEDDYDTASFRQNTEVPDGNHWLIALNLDRWRNAQDLATYLRWAARSVEALNASRQSEQSSATSGPEDVQ